jgi:DNA-binding LacI/PurR family transcriptional regulator
MLERRVVPTESLTSGRRVIGTLRRRIQAGVYGGGQPLPSGRQLAQELGADRGTVMRAIEVLRQQGVITQVSPRIVVVNENAASPAAAPQSVLAQTVVLVAVDGRAKLQRHRQPGWVEYIAMGAMPAIEEAGLHALSFHPARLREEGLGALIQGRPHGVIFSDLLTESGQGQMLTELREAGIPFVAYGDGPLLERCDRVTSDHEQGCYLLTRWMIERGRRRILCFWHNLGDVPWLAERRRGYERAMREAGLEPLPTAEHPDKEHPREADAFRNSARLAAGHLAEHLLRENAVDAVLLTSDGDVAYAAAACRLLGKSPESDVLLAGYDNYWADTPERQAEPTPPVITIDKQNTQIGAELVRLLRQRIAGELPDAPQCRRVEPRLVEPQASGVTGLDPGH